MTLGAAMEMLRAVAVVPAPDESAELGGCFAADLMSDVLAFASAGCLLISGLVTHQTLRTASIKHLPAVVIIEGKQVGDDMIETAREEAVGVYRTELSKYEACGLLMQGGLGSTRRDADSPGERA